MKTHLNIILNILTNVVSICLVSFMYFVILVTPFFLRTGIHLVRTGCSFFCNDSYSTVEPLAEQGLCNSLRNINIFHFHFCITFLFLWKFRDWIFFLLCLEGTVMNYRLICINKDFMLCLSDSIFLGIFQWPLKWIAVVTGVGRVWLRHISVLQPSTSLLKCWTGSFKNVCSDEKIGLGDPP